MPFLRQLYKQKPQAWGPPSAVQASIFKNAERIGIDPESISLCVPMWSPGSFIDYSYKNLKSILGVIPPIFSNNSLLFSGTEYIPFPAGSVEVQEHTLFSIIKPSSISYKMIGGICNSIALGGVEWAIYTPGKLSFAYKSASAIRGWYESANVIVEVNKKQDIAIRWRQSEGKVDFFVDGANKGYAVTISEQIVYNNDNPDIGHAHSNAKFAGEMWLYLLFNRAIKDDQIAYLSDNPYSLLYRVPPVFYSVPGGTPPTFNPLFLNAAQPTRVIQ